MDKFKRANAENVHNTGSPSDLLPRSQMSEFPPRLPLYSVALDASDESLMDDILSSH
jgi:hypothetical protein